MKLVADRTDFPGNACRDFADGSGTSPEELNFLYFRAALFQEEPAPTHVLGREGAPESGQTVSASAPSYFLG